MSVNSEFFGDVPSTFERDQETIARGRSAIRVLRNTQNMSRLKVVGQPDFQLKRDARGKLRPVPWSSFYLNVSTSATKSYSFKPKTRIRTGPTPFSVACPDSTMTAPISG